MRDLRRAKARASGAVRVAASLWSVRQGQRQETLGELVKSGLTTVHWDTTDGVFATAGGLDADSARDMTATAGLSAEAHLMVADPLNQVDAWTDFCDIVVVHAESRNWREALNRIALRGSQPALALSPGTPASVVASVELAVLSMSIVPGTAGAAFNPAALDSVRTLREKHALRETPAFETRVLHGAADTSERLLGLDGGVTLPIARNAVSVGANWLVSGTDLCQSTDPRAWLAAVGSMQR
jgi:ribulose-phosphate 3-epimerase